ncbi:hypothetical protein [Virgibacillus tibetensis]
MSDIEKKLDLILDAIAELKDELSSHRNDTSAKLEQIESMLRETLDEREDLKANNKSESDKSERLKIVTKEPRVKFGEVGVDPHTEEVMKQNDNIINRGTN